ncbi:hypothetical protein ELZ95_04840 [Salmonella enterica subsp. enterica serovar Moero]|uniref:Uncharacterized protein n=1 Tax=Salmonella enterica subsp. enterica serovar Moero TaxID=2500154 RepID=A0A3Q9KWZ1_SALET|nr:hypothetical protein ELZ95_04840 [Salmonella enterica subsp. enterica serovar Moero]
MDEVLPTAGGLSPLARGTREITLHESLIPWFIRWRGEHMGNEYLLEYTRGLSAGAGNTVLYSFT